MALLMAGMSSHTALALNFIEQAAQTELISKLKENDYRPRVDGENGNVMITKNDETVWITIKGQSSPLYYTINVKGYNFVKENEHLTLEQRRNLAAKTAAEINNQTTCKVKYDNGDVSFYMPMYSSSPSDVVKSIDTIFKQLTSAKSQFTTQYNQNQAAYIKKLKEEPEKKAYVVVEQISELPKTNIKCNITGYAVRVVDGSGNEVIGYDKSIRKDKAMFIQESIQVTSEEKGVCAVGVKIYNPDGQLMVPFPSAKYTTINVFEVNKPKKGTDIQLEKFGFDQPGKWAAGDYRLEFVINDQTVYTGSFTIL